MTVSTDHADGGGGGGGGARLACALLLLLAALPVEGAAPESGLLPDVAWRWGWSTARQTLGSMANARQGQGELGAALELYERALAIEERALGPEHSLVGIGLVCVGGH